MQSIKLLNVVSGRASRQDEHGDHAAACVVRVFAMGFLVAAFRFSNSKPTLAPSSLRKAENGLPFFEMKRGIRSVFPVSMSLINCSRGTSRWQIVLPMRNLQFPVLLHW